MNIPKRRIQDGFKPPFLCRECEQKFSKYEDHFKKKYLLSSCDQKNIDSNDDSLRYFILSLHWRILSYYSSIDNNSMNSMSENEKDVFYKKIENWRIILKEEDLTKVRSINMKLIPTQKIEGIRDFKNFFLKQIIFDYCFQPKEDSFDFFITYIQVPKYIFICELWGNYPKMKQFSIGKKIPIRPKITFPKEIMRIHDKYYDKFVNSAEKLSQKQIESIINNASKKAAQIN